jgi:hypothetical protein
MKTKKGNTTYIAIIIVVVAITAGVIGYLFAKKTQTLAQQTLLVQPATTVPISSDVKSTPNWKTYTNSEFGFQFDYLTSSGFDSNKLKVEGWDCAEKERCVVLSLPTTDKDFAPSNWIQNPTKEDLAKPATYTVLYIHIVDKDQYDKIISKDCIKDNNISAYCQPDKLHKGNKVYSSSDGKSIYLFDNLYGEKPVQDKPYPDDGIAWSDLGNFKAL